LRKPVDQKATPVFFLSIEKKKCAGKKLSWFLLPAPPCLPPPYASASFVVPPHSHPRRLLHFVRHLPGAWPLANDDALRCAPGYIKAETRSGGAFVATHDKA
jgi:hypothetical protein